MRNCLGASRGVSFHLLKKSLLLLAALLSLPPGLPAVEMSPEVKAVLENHCFACHGPDLSKNKGDLRLDISEVATAPIKISGNRAIVPSNPAKSALVNRILSHDEDFMMPPTESNLKLTTEEKAILIKWIENGAEYKKHWAFIAPKNT